MQVAKLGFGKTGFQDNSDGGLHDGAVCYAYSEMLMSHPDTKSLSEARRLEEIQRYIAHPHPELEDLNAMQAAFYQHVGTNNYCDKSYLRLPADPSVWCAEPILPSTYTDAIEVKMCAGPAVESATLGRYAVADRVPCEPESALAASQQVTDDHLARPLMIVSPPPAQLILNAVEGVTMPVLGACLV